MITRAATLLAAASLAAVAVPAFAQDDYHPGPPPPLPEVGGAAWDEDWDGDWDEYSEPAYEEGAKWDRRRGYWERRHRSPRAAMGYSEDQRARWIEQCRANYEDASGSRRGAAIGGVLGAVAGGIAGNRIADGERLGGTLIGAGVGGLAGAAVGGAIGTESDRNRAERRVDACEDYLLRYEHSFVDAGSGHGAYGYGYPPAPVAWIKVPIVTKRHHRDCGCEVLVEERIEEEPAPAPRAKRVKIRRIAPDKRTAIAK